MNQKVFLITPPFTQLNTPYPATAYLKGFLNTQNINSFQCDLGIEVILELFSKKGLTNIFNSLDQKDGIFSENTERIISLQAYYIQTIEPVISFLHDKNPTFAHVICERNFLPEASRFQQIEDLDWAFGTMGIRDKARHLATLYLEDISDLIKENVDAHFGFSRYAERLGASASSFSELNDALTKKNNYIDEILISILKEKIEEEKPSLVAISVPFPGNLYGALKCGQWIKNNHPEIKVCMGGGFPNTELRSLSDPRVFKFVDFITLDDGEAPILNLLEFLDGKRVQEDLKRTFLLENGLVKYINNSRTNDFKQKDVGTPDYSDLPLNKYLSVIEIANPMHRLWNDGRWNKLTLAHGCYWGKCTFCDISLDYIETYQATTANILVDRIETIIEQTGNNGFHFVDEAAPPALMRDLALELIRRKITIVWWTNIRFEKSFTADLVKLLAYSGCIAVSGGLEVASDRLLNLIDKGVTVAQVANVTSNFTGAGIMVHSYLMYGFPTQTEQETIDSLEMVRQLFEIGAVQSGFWHRFAMTAHSPIGLNPEKFNVKKTTNKIGTFANNEIEFIDNTACDHAKFSEGLKKSLFNFMHGIGFEMQLQQWFNFEIPRTLIPKNYIQRALNDYEEKELKPSSKIYFLGLKPSITFFAKNKKGKCLPMAELTFHTRNYSENMVVSENLGKWIHDLLSKIEITNKQTFTLDATRKSFEENGLGNFKQFLNGEIASQLVELGLIVL